MSGAHPCVAHGVELSQGLARFGAKVTILEGGPRILAPEEPEASTVVTEVLRREGIDVRVNAKTVTRIIVPFEGYAGRYVWHCHILEHEDNEMMRPYEVLAPGS